MRTVFYEDFTVALGSSGRGIYRARVVKAPYGAESRDFELPYRADELEAMLHGLEHKMRWQTSESTRHLRSSTTAPADVEPSQVGADLYRAVFSDSIGDSFLQSLASVENRSDVRLRLRLHFDPSTAGSAQLARLPWELLHREETGDFLSRDVMTPVLRQWSFPRRTAPPPLEDRLRVLVVLANPPRTPRLDLEAERERIQEIWEQSGAIEVEVLTRPTVKKLQEKLRSKPFQVLHFMGHGDFEPLATDGVLYFEPGKDRDLVTGHKLAETVKGSRSLRLVFLNACDTARFSVSEDRPLTGLAAALLRAGIPAVIAMQFPITDRAAKVFSESFYSGLAAGELLETAVTEGRRSMFLENPETYEWAVPVLYMSLPEGYLFDVTSGRLMLPSAERLLRPSVDDASQPIPATPRSEMDDGRGLRVLLEKVKSAWIDGVLRESKHNRTTLELGIKQRFDLVERPLAQTLEIPDQERKTLPSDRKIVEVFQQSRTLLILGEPGSGKTTTLLELARDLIELAEREALEPVPVVFHLSTWTRTHRKIETWLIEELRDKYRIPTELGRSWLEGHRLLILLDGLDEVRFEDRAACVTAINELAKSVGLTGLAVCSRLHEYQVLPELLQLDAAIMLQPLTTEQIDAYLEAGGDDTIPLRRALRKDLPLRVLAQTPLMLNVMSLAYREGELPSEQIESAEGHRKHLFDTYVERALRRNVRGELGTRAEARRWLAWLACLLNRRNQNIFMVESLQPELLETRRARLGYLALSRLLPGMPVSFGWILPVILLHGDWITGMLMSVLILISASASGTLVDLLRFERAPEPVSETPDYRRYAKELLHLASRIAAFALGFTVFFTLFVTACNHAPRFRGFAGVFEIENLMDAIGTGCGFGGILSAIYVIRARRRDYSSDIQTVETLKWSGAKAVKSATRGMAAGIFASLLISIFVALDGTLTDEDLWMATLGFGTIGAVLGMTFGGFAGESLDSKDRPNEGILLSIKKSMILGIATFLIISCLGLVISHGEDWIEVRIPFVIMGVTLGWIVANWYGGLDVLQHYLLRWMLARQGDVSFRYPGFLDQAARRVLLQKVGGGYIFVHRLFQEHFAAIHGVPTGRSRRSVRSSDQRVDRRSFRRL